MTNFPNSVDSFTDPSPSSDTAVLSHAGQHTNANDAIAAIEAYLLQTLTGMLVAFAGAAAPVGWLICDGSAVSRATYARLFAVIGTAYGIGDGSTTFNLPDGRDRTIVGVSPGSLSGRPTARSLGQTGGEESHTLTVAESPSHSHSIQGGSNFLVNDGGGANVANGAYLELGNGPQSTDSAGGGGSHNNMQPFAVANWIIKT